MSATPSNVKNDLNADWLKRLSNGQRELQDKATAAQREVMRAQFYTTEAYNFLTNTGVGCAGGCIQQAIERLQAALKLIES